MEISYKKRSNRVNYVKTHKYPHKILTIKNNYDIIKKDLCKHINIILI